MVRPNVRKLFTGSDDLSDKTSMIDRDLEDIVLFDNRAKYEEKDPNTLITGLKEELLHWNTYVEVGSIK